MAIFSIGCGGDDSPGIDPVQEVIDGLEKTWRVTSVTFGNDDDTADWNGFTLTFDQSQGYTASRLSDESVLVWPTSGSYHFPNSSNSNLVERDDGVQINISNLTETSATLTFTISGRSGSTGGKEDGLIGAWVFEMSAN